ncbi:MAG: fructosamine kinase family protein [Proteobacteria bacterium]|nr:fructosamine kinase family protein [Pseudomonadota bacterium]MCP4920991.1 fructosamine kinase family protein [Pseudomonadota bacterium]
MHGEDPLSPEHLARVSAGLGVEARLVQTLPGGDINRAALIDAAGEPVFVKWNADPVDRMFACEAEGLSALRDAHTLRVPKVRAIGPDFLAMEYIASATAAPDFDEKLGRGLAALHRVRGLRFGFHQDGVLGVVPQPNAWADSWVAFYRHRRVEPLAAEAERRGSLSGATLKTLRQVTSRLGSLIPAGPAPSRLHGDLWSGNVMASETGDPVLVDPAVFHGHREMDLAMTELFGGFSPRFYAAYREAWPLEPGYERRREVYQIVPLLIHVILFGGPYEHQLRACLSRLS